ncbi:MAG: alanine racemase [Clostridia bacterium]|nr:alanine racemase [Clostridia bacterium]
MAEIDVSRLKNNVREIRKTVGDGVKICAVVKADAYGHGAVEIARRIENLVDFFAVALAEEGAELRLCGITKPVLLLLPTDEFGLERAIRYSLTLSVDNLPYLRKINAKALALKKRATVHLAANTGMNRFGFSKSEFESACIYAKSLRSISVEGVFSHFYNPADGAETDRQFEKFLYFTQTAKRYFGDIIRHISASGGVMAGRKYDLDMVRPGLLLYGYKPFEGNAPEVSPILKVRANVLKRLRVKKGDHLLYGDFTAEKDEEIILARAGYADGLRRNGKFSVNNKCMDVCALRGDADDDGRITLFSDADAFAEAENTISYEILCGITKRSHFIYKD